MRIESHLEELASQAIYEALGEARPAMLRPTQDPQHGDYQINGVMPLAKTLKRPPRELAQAVAVTLLRQPSIASAEVAGPGFVNLRVDLNWLADIIRTMATDRDRIGVDRVDAPQKIVVDFSGPNIAKEPHVGHLRSTILGDALVRILRFVGHEVIGDNHLGDWGTQFGLLIAGMERFGSNETLTKEPLAELERVYKLASAASKSEPDFAARARAELAKLQAGDPDNQAWWRRFVDITKQELDRVYTRLDVHFDTWLGESFYNPMLPDVVARLIDAGIAREDQGAICVFFEDVPDLAKLGTPLIVRKQDGAFNYATTDVATLIYRRDTYAADRVLYVVDQRQALHFKQVFSVARKLGLGMQLEHVGFGAVLGSDGKPLKTKAGTNVKLAALLDEAEERAAQRMREEGVALDDESIRHLAPLLGIGAVKYADLRQNRSSDYQFDWDKMISFKGNASPYLQYAHARIQAIFRKGSIDPTALEAPAPILLDAPAEQSLAKQLVRFPEILHQAANLALPHLICDHLYAVAKSFSVFFESCPVLKSEAEVRASRLALADLAGRQLAMGLHLLGIAAPDRM